MFLIIRLAYLFNKSYIIFTLLNKITLYKGILNFIKGYNFLKALYFLYIITFNGVPLLINIYKTFIILISLFNIYYNNFLYYISLL